MGGPERQTVADSGDDRGPDGKLTEINPRKSSPGTELIVEDIEGYEMTRSAATESAPARRRP